MNTTNLFVELIVIGVGAFAWVALLFLALVGINGEMLARLIATPAAVAPALAITYLLGIITDRLADSLFRFARMESKHRDCYEGGTQQYFKDRTLALAGSEQFAQLYEYSRSRQRICRGWAVNAIAIFISLNIFLMVHREYVPNGPRIALVTSVFLLALAVACWLSWEAMSDTELKRIKEQADVLSNHQVPR